MNGMPNDLHAAIQGVGHVTNFESNVRPLYDNAVREANTQLGRAEFFINNEAFDCDGVLLPNYNALHTVTDECDDGQEELTMVFLKIHSRLSAEKQTDLS